VSRALTAWIERESPLALQGMLKSISPLAITHHRAGFGQTIVPVRGAIVASPVRGSYDPDPDYFYHWFRDSAIIVDALRLAYLDGSPGAGLLGHLADYVHFSLSLRQLDGRRLLEQPLWRQAVASDHRQYLREDADLAGVRGARVEAESRVNADGTLDFTRWARPQHDGPPLRALTLMRWMRDASLPAPLSASIAALVRTDLAYARHFSPEPCYDIWEEDLGLHYYTLRVAAAALHQGATWVRSVGSASGQDDELARGYLAQADAITSLLNDFWLPEEGHYRSRRLPGGVRSGKELDISVILAAVHAGEYGGMHSPQDERQQATLDRLCTLFSGAYPINRASPGIGPAMGRYAGDRYYSGGAWYLATLGAAEFCYRAGDWRRGDGFFETVRRFTPDDGALSEQFDQRTGQQTSAKQLAWSYAAFISCVVARRAAMG
jgi:glucoamylase